MSEDILRQNVSIFLRLLKVLTLKLVKDVLELSILFFQPLITTTVVYTATLIYFCVPESISRTFYVAFDMIRMIIDPEENKKNRIRAMSLSSMDTEWLNRAISLSWCYGLSDLCKRMCTDALIDVLAESSSMGLSNITSCELAGIKIGEASRNAPVVLAIKVPPPVASDYRLLHSSEIGSLSMEVDFSWTSRDSTISFRLSKGLFFEEIRMELKNFEVSGKAHCTFLGPTVAMIPWKRVRVTFMDRPNFDFSHFISTTRRTSTSCDSGNSGGRSDLASIAVSGFLSLMKTRLRASVMHPKGFSVEIND